MKKLVVILIGAAMLMSSCDTYQASGAYTGSMFGNMVGSAIGGIAGGWRGQHTGSLIGTVGGAVAGAVIGSAIDKSQERRMAPYGDRRQHDDSGFDPQGRGDDRIMIAPAEAPLVVRHAVITETQNDGVLVRGEECTAVFEIMNTSDNAVFDVQPFVEDATGNKHIKISDNLRIESIGPRQGVRYTATILADKRLKDGEIIVRLGVAQGGREITSQTREFRVPTAKKRP